MVPFAPCQTSSPSPPLNEGEKRRVLSQLYELKAAREANIQFQQVIQRELDLYEKEKVAWQRTVDLEKQATQIAIQERDLARQQRDHYKALYESVVKKPGGFGCVLKKLFTIGIARCR